MVRVRVGGVCNGVGGMDSLKPFRADDALEMPHAYTKFHFLGLGWGFHGVRYEI